MEVVMSVLDVSPVQLVLSPLDQTATWMESNTGLPKDQVNFLLLFLLAYPLALIHRQIYNPTLRHIFAIVFGVLTMIYVIGNEVYHSLFSITVAYIIMKFMPNKTGHQIVWVWAFGYMSASHIYRLWVDYLGWSVDFTTSQMVFTLKMVAFACNVYDGHMKNKQNLSSRQLHYSLPKEEFPSLLKYYSYMYFWCTVLPGPFFEYKDYVQFIDRTLFKNKEVPAGSFVAFGWIWAKIVLCLVGVIYGFQVPVSKLYDADFIANNSFAYRFIYMMICCMTIRSKYYTGWLMSEGSGVLCGFGFNGYDKEGKPTWNRLTNVNLVGVELAQNLRDVVSEWNKGTALWLKNYVYFRVTRKPTKPGEKPSGKGLTPELGQLVVFSVSAMWHGFYPGYYYFFISYFFFSMTANSLTKIVTAKVYTEKASPVVKYLYTALCILLTIAVLDFLATSFAVLANSYTFTVWGSFYFAPHVICVVVFALIKVLKLDRTRRPRIETIDSEKEKEKEKGKKQQ